MKLDVRVWLMAISWPVRTLDVISLLLFVELPAAALR